MSAEKLSALYANKAEGVKARRLEQNDDYQQICVSRIISKALLSIQAFVLICHESRNAINRLQREIFSFSPIKSLTLLANVTLLETGRQNGWSFSRGWTRKDGYESHLFSRRCTPRDVLNIKGKLRSFRVPGRDVNGKEGNNNIPKISFYGLWHMTRET